MHKSAGKKAKVKCPSSSKPALDGQIESEHVNGVMGKIAAEEADNCPIIDELAVNGDCSDKHIKHTRKKRTKLKEEEAVDSTEITSDSQSKDGVEEVVDKLVAIKLEECPDEDDSVKFQQYESELQMPMIMKIIQKDLSEPYSIYTYRYFIHNWPKLCYLAMCEDKCVGAIVCKLDTHRKVIKRERGYIAMLAVDKEYRKKQIGSRLVQLAIEEMIRGDADEVVLETEVTNKPALQLYEKLGFVRDKRLFRYYLNGVDALRLKLWLR